MRVLRPGCWMASVRLCVPAPGLLLLGQLAILLPFSFTPGVCGQKVEVLQSPESVSVAAGEQATLKCTVTVTGGHVPGPVRWFKGSGAARTPIYPEKVNDGTFPRISRVLPDSNTDISITISNISPADAGTYYCVKFQRSTDIVDKEIEQGRGTNLSVNAIPSPQGEGDPSQFQYYVIAACLALLLLLVLAVVIFMWTKKKRDKDIANRRSMRSSRTAQAPNNKDLTYADLEFQQRPPNQRSTVAQNDHCEYASVQTGAQPQKDNLTYAELDTVRLNQGPTKAIARPVEANSEYAEVQIRKQ